MNLVKELEEELKYGGRVFLGGVDNLTINLIVNAILYKIDELGFDIVEKDQENITLIDD